MLFKDNKKIPDYASFTGTIEYAAIKPTLRMIENDHLVKLLGNELYSSLNSALALITDETSLSPDNQLLLHQCRMVIGPYLCYYYTPKAEIGLSASGARRSETETEKTAFQYQITNFREVNLREAEKASEQLLQFLDENQSSYSQWVNSKAFAAYKSLFIASASEFDENYKTASPYRNYWAMRWKMFDVEELHIRIKLGDPLFDSLKTKLLANTLSTKETKLLKFVKKAIAYYTIAFALPDLSVRLDDDGLTVVGITRSSNDKDRRQDATENKFSNIVNNAQAAGSEWLVKSMDYLKANATDFPLYQPIIIPPEAQTPGNEGLKAAFGLY